MDLSRRQKKSNINGVTWAAMALMVVAQPGALAQGFPQGQINGGPGYNQGQGNQGAPNQNTQATNPALIKDWFGKYDMVRRQAQMTPAERAKADDLLSHGLQMFVPGEEKIVAHNLLTNLVSKYDRACSALKMMPLYPETSALHHKYFQYFSDAQNLFADYLRVQNNLMVKDQNGNSVMAGLITRKQNLEVTEQQAKSIDSDVRSRFGIPPYRY